MKNKRLWLVISFILISVIVFDSFRYMDSEEDMRARIDDLYEKKYSKKIVAFSDAHGLHYKAIGCVDEDNRMSMFILKKHPMFYAYRIKGQQPAIEPSDDMVIRHDITNDGNQVSLFCVNNLDNTAYMLNLWHKDNQMEYGVGINRDLEIIGYANTLKHYSKYYLKDEDGNIITKEYGFE